MIRKRTIITFSLLLSFIGAFLLQFSQMTSLCYYGIYPLACLLAFICFNNIQKIEKSIESISGTVLVAFFATSFIFGTVQGTSMGVLYWLPYVYLALILIFISRILEYALKNNIFNMYFYWRYTNDWNNFASFST